jgi:hypothetical protein
MLQFPRLQNTQLRYNIPFGRVLLASLLSVSVLTSCNFPTPSEQQTMSEKLATLDQRNNTQLTRDINNITYLTAEQKVNLKKALTALNKKFVLWGVTEVEGAEKSKLYVVIKLHRLPSDEYFQQDQSEHESLRSKEDKWITQVFEEKGIYSKSSVQYFKGNSVASLTLDGRSDGDQIRTLELKDVPKLEDALNELK